MKKLVLSVMFLGFGIGGMIFAYAQAQNIGANITKIDVDFQRNVAMIYMSTGTGLTTTTEVDEPAFDGMINGLSQAGALNLPAVQQAILNSIGG